VTNLSKFYNLVNNEKGNVAVLSAFLFIGLLGIAGIAIDGSLYFMTKTHLQKTANAAVISGAQQLTNIEDQVKIVVSDILKAHKEETSLKSVHVEMDKKVEVNLEKPLKLSFSRIFGVEEVDVKAHAAAEVRTIGRATGAAPLGIDYRTPLEFNKTYSLKVDSSENVTGNFGILALGGPGAKTYEENLRHGYQEELKVGMVVNTQTGNIAGKTRETIKERVDACPETSSSMYDRNCSRIILVLVYKPLQPDGSKLDNVEIKGFAYFYIIDPMSANDTSINGMFIKLVGPGFEEDGSVSRGAYKIRITE
jgi:hypothetical protein